MNRFFSFGSLLTVAGVMLAQSAPTANACAVCMGAPGTPTADALNGAIFIMLGVLASVMAGIAAVVFSFIRRADRMAANLPSPESMGSGNVVNLS